MDYEGVSQAVRVFGRFPFAFPPHSPVVGRVVNLGRPPHSSDVSSTTWRFFGLSAFEAGVLGRWGFLFLNQFGCVSLGLTFCYELAGQRWIEGQIDLSSSGTAPSIDHRAYSTLTEFILLKRNRPDRRLLISPADPCACGSAMQLKKGSPFLLVSAFCDLPPQSAFSDGRTHVIDFRFKCQLRVGFAQIDLCRGRLVPLEDIRKPPSLSKCKSWLHSFVEPWGSPLALVNHHTTLYHTYDITRSECMVGTTPKAPTFLAANTTTTYLARDSTTEATGSPEGAASSYNS
ncbi:hypothetical protein HAX54_047746 [Datura stramonium]|uniref:DUF1618 domain-containing protein n=1 Tax=Datura stramonium TaxID=4076 RepID=A0ABS8SSU2_DATST|nr:hypothetical protein [Datura stramonium]